MVVCWPKWWAKESARKSVLWKKIPRLGDFFVGVVLRFYLSNRVVKVNPWDDGVLALK